MCTVALQKFLKIISGNILLISDGGDIIKHQNIDKFFKVSAILFGQLFVDFFGLNYHIIHLYRNELNTFDGKTLFSDLVFETREGVLLNFEFQNIKIQKKHLKKYMDYKVHLQCQSGKRVVTAVDFSY